MEFKGTKVFPKYEGGDNYSIDMIFESGATISIDRRDRYSDEVVMTREEMEANAKLITCAREMLETIKDLLIDIEEITIPTSMNETIIKAHQLIKKATE